MIIAELDSYLPFLIFSYGLLAVAMFEHPSIQILLQKHSPFLVPKLKSQQILAWSCFFCGGLWILQDLWVFD